MATSMPIGTKLNAKFVERWRFDMSQHRCSAVMPDGTPVDVLMGWDRPTEQFFLVVEMVKPDEEGPVADEYVYSNLDDPEAISQPLAYFGDKLTMLGIKVPEAMFFEIGQDRLRNVGNRDVWYDSHGISRERS